LRRDGFEVLISLLKEDEQSPRYEIDPSDSEFKHSFRRFGNSRNVEVPPGTRMNAFVEASVTNTARLERINYKG
jgi:hypothetical protein